MVLKGAEASNADKGKTGESSKVKWAAKVGAGVLEVAVDFVNTTADAKQHIVQVDRAFEDFLDGLHEVRKSDSTRKVLLEDSVNRFWGR